MSMPLVLLGFLEPSPRHGYDLKREYDERFPNFRPLRYGQIYATLARLDRDGLVTLARESVGRGPDRKEYAITPSGVTELEEWLSTPLEVGKPANSELFLKVALALLSERPADQLLVAQREVHLERMRQLTQAKREAQSDADVVLYDFELFHLEADLKWIDHTERRLDQLAQEFNR